MKFDLIFDDWQKDGQSIYQTELGVQLSLGDLHSGTTWDNHLPREILAEIREAWENFRAYPIFRLIPREEED